VACGQTDFLNPIGVAAPWLFRPRGIVLKLLLEPKRHVTISWSRLADRDPLSAVEAESYRKGLSEEYVNSPADVVRRHQTFTN